MTEIVELYQFALGVDTMRYTSADRDIMFDGQGWASSTIIRDEREVTEELNRNRLELEVPRDHPVAALFAAGQPEELLSVTLFQAEVDMDDTVLQSLTLWKGRVLGCAWSDSLAALECEPLSSAMRRAGLRARYQSQCRHVLYDAGCRVQPAQWAQGGTLAEVDGAAIRAEVFASQADGWWVAGFVLIAGARRMVTAHAGEWVTLSGAIIGLEPGIALQAFPGCAHNTEACAEKFDNIENYGGFPYVPGDNPFGGSSIV